MTSSSRERFSLVLAFLLPCSAALALMAPDGLIRLSTGVVLAGLGIAIAAVVLMTWQNAQATASVGQLLHETEVGAVAPVTVGTVASTSASRWQTWQTRGEGLARTGRIRALFALSLAVTFAIVYVWMA